MFWLRSTIRPSCPCLLACRPISFYESWSLFCIFFLWNFTNSATVQWKVSKVWSVKCKASVECGNRAAICFCDLGWALNIALLANYNDYSDIIVSITSLVECFRRFVWNFFRLENEHVNNAPPPVRDINLRPLRKAEVGKIGRKVTMFFRPSPPSNRHHPSFDE